MQEPLSLPDQVDEAINYIRSLEEKLKKSQERKESLMGRKRSYTCTTYEAIAIPKSPQIEIREMGSSLQIVLITGLDNQYIFYEAIHILHEEQADVLNANFSIAGDSIFHVVHAEVLCSTRLVNFSRNILLAGSLSFPFFLFNCIFKFVGFLLV